ncbi:hypothetical protein FK178_10755 [Antarcticibacterium arcticum]|uniref:Potassium channel domain-containing protein n=1 Tax=Antarcticibacterium arcticum TaxID=2585771 RepID=A0A5B8YMW5_9FLAO|nr:ion channel [Antarcticibacterium arcticum]QED38167.1 hypothetical protein FK178_10755 [Antarcticibacterium arcticum]
MNGIASLIIGIAILLVVMYDFFFTTLSGSGAGFISKIIARLSHKVIQVLVKLFGRQVYSYSGLFVNLKVLAGWILLVWTGLFLVYSSHPDAIVNNEGMVANLWERLYFTGYVLSTLGMGNFYPTSGFFEILTGVFSFFGFIFFTSSITYFLSVSSALVKKRILAKTINNLGNSPAEITASFKSLDKSYTLQQLQALQEMVDEHAVNHQAYPVIHYYSHPEPVVCLSINLTRLDEALSHLLRKDEMVEFRKELNPLRNSLTNLLDHIYDNFSKEIPSTETFKSGKSPGAGLPGVEDKNLEYRRRVLDSLLRSEGFNWKDVD